MSPQREAGRPPAAAEAPASGATCSLAELARLLDLSPPRINQLSAQGIIPKPKTRGRYRPVESVRGYIRYLRELADKEQSTLTDEEIRYTRVRAEKIELELAVRRAELVPGRAAIVLWENAIAACRAKLLAVPAKMAPLVFACKTLPQIKEEIERAIHDALSELHRGLDPADYLDPESLEGLGPSAEADGEPVGRRTASAQPGGQRRARAVADRARRVPAGADGRGERPAGRGGRT